MFSHGTHGAAPHCTEPTQTTREQSRIWDLEPSGPLKPDYRELQLILGWGLPLGHQSQPTNTAKGLRWVANGQRGSRHPRGD